MATSRRSGGVWGSGAQCWHAWWWGWVVVWFFYMDCAAGLYTFDVFRMIQYDRTGLGAFGTQRTSVSLQAVSLADLARSDHYDMGRSKMVVAPYDQLDLALVDDANDRAGGLLVLLPPPDVRLERAAIDRWTDLERQLVARELRIPVYFAVRSPAIDDLVSTLSHHRGSGGEQDTASRPAAQGGGGGLLSWLYRDEYVMATSVAEPYPIKGVAITNLQVRSASILVVLPCRTGPPHDRA